MDAPPPHPPPLLSGSEIHQLCTSGYVGLQLRPHLAANLAHLLAATDAFFALPDATKDLYKPGASRGPPCSPTSSERGYSRLPGEKEFLTLRRSLTHLPATTSLPAAAAAVWRDAAQLLHRILGDIGVYLGLDLGPAAWDAVVKDSLEPGCYGPSRTPRDDPPTVLRLFRYEPGGGGAEQHRDLGLVTLCVCWGKGLQLQPQPPSSLPTEAAHSETAGPAAWIDAPQVTVMTGDTLHVFSNRRIPSAVHRVVVDEPPSTTPPVTATPAKPAKPATPATSRRSIVFALRATVAGSIDLAPFGIEGSVNALSLYDGIRERHVNINTSKETRMAMRAEFSKRSGKALDQDETARPPPAPETEIGIDTDADRQYSDTSHVVGVA